MKDLKRKAKTQTPKEAYHAVHKEHGGVLSAYSLSDLPRNRAQAKYLRRGQSVPKNLKKKGSLVILLEQCKRQQLHRDEQSFTREIVGAPELRCVLSFDWQLQDIVVFCNDPAKNSVLGRGGSSLKSDRIIFGGAADYPERRSRELARGVRGHAPPENFEN